MEFENLISEMYYYTRMVLEAFGVYGKDEELLESREELCCRLAQEEAEKICGGGERKNSAPAFVKLTLESGKVIYVNTALISDVFFDYKFTIVDLVADQRQLKVAETPDEVIEAIYEANGR